MPELYVYYRVRAGQEAQQLQRLDAWRNHLRAQHAGWCMQVLKRQAAEGGSDPSSSSTWMETYRFHLDDASAHAARPSQAQLHSLQTELNQWWIAQQGSSASERVLEVFELLEP